MGGERRAHATPAARPGVKTVFSGGQSGQHAVFSGACSYRAVQYAYTRLILKLCGSPGPTGYSGTETLITLLRRPTGYDARLVPEPAAVPRWKLELEAVRREKKHEVALSQWRRAAGRQAEPIAADTKLEAAREALMVMQEEREASNAGREGYADSRPNYSYWQ